MPRLIWVFARHTVTLLVLPCRGSYTIFKKQFKCKITLFSWNCINIMFLCRCINIVFHKIAQLWFYDSTPVSCFHNRPISYFHDTYCNSLTFSWQSHCCINIIMYQYLGTAPKYMYLITKSGHWLLLGLAMVWCTFEKSIMAKKVKAFCDFFLQFLSFIM